MVYGLWIVFFSVGLKSEAEEKMSEQHAKLKPGGPRLEFSCAPHYPSRRLPAVREAVQPMKCGVRERDGFCSCRALLEHTSSGWQFDGAGLASCIGQDHYVETGL